MRFWRNISKLSALLDLSIMVQATNPNLIRGKNSYESRKLVPPKSAN